MRARLFAGSAPGDEWVLVVVMHHAVTDGWSMAPFARDLSAAYAARCQGRAPGWPALPVQYADYAIWQRDLLGSPDDPGSLASRQVAYWARRCGARRRNWRCRRSGPARRWRRTAVAGWRCRSAPGCTGGWRSWPGRTGRACSWCCRPAFAALLSRLGAGTDIPVGTPIAGRTDEALDGLVGMFVNTLVLRTDSVG